MMRKNSFPRWLAVASVFAIVAVVTGSVWFYRTQEEHLRRRAETELQGIAHLKADEIADWRQAQLANAYVLMESPFLSEQVARLMASSHPENTKDMLARLRSLQKHYRYSDVLLVNAHGQVRLRIGGIHDSLCPHMTQSLAEALRKRRPILTDIHAGAGTVPPHIGIIAPIFAKSGAANEQVGGIILLADVQKSLYPLIQSWPTPSRTAETLLVRRDGDSVLFLNDLRFRKNTASRLRIPLSHKDAPAVMAALGRLGVVQGRDYRGVEVLSALEAVPDSPWFIVAKVDTEEVFAAWRFRSILILALTLLLVLIAVAAAGLVWQRNDKAHYQGLARVQADVREREQNLSTTLNSIGDAVISTDVQGRVVGMNPVAEELTGWTLSEAIARPISEVINIVNALTGEPAPVPVDEVLSTGEVCHLANHTTLISRDGTQRQIADSAAPILNDSGDVTGVVLVFSDVTEQYRIREALLESEERHKSLFESSSDAIMTLEPPSWKFTSCNQRTVEVFGAKNVKEFTSLGPWGVSPKLQPDGRASGDKAKEMIETAMREGSCSFEWTHMKIGGEEFPADVLLSRMQQGGKTLLQATVRDVTTQKQAEEALQESEEQYRVIFEGSAHGILITDSGTGRFMYANPSICRMLGYTESELLQLGVADIHPREALGQLQSEMESIARGERTIVNAVLPCLRKDGTVFYAEVTPAMTKRGGRICNVGFFTDITERKQAEEALRMEKDNLAAVLASSPIGMLLLNEEMMIVEANAVIASMVSRDAEEVIHQRGGGGLGCVHSFEDEKGCGFSSVCPDCSFWQEIMQVLEDGTSIHGAEIQTALMIDGQEHRPWLRISAEPVIINGRRHVIVAIDDVTEHKRAEEALALAKAETEVLNRQLEEALLVSKDHAAAVEVAKDQIEENAVELLHQATHDALTGLPNRQYFEQHLRECITGCAGKKSRSFTMLFLDLDQFKLINDTLGHKVGDLLLVEVADRLQSCIRSEDILARMGGDEFTVILPRRDRRSIAQTVASRMIDSISRPFEIQGHKFVIGASIGLASYPSDGTDTVSLLKHADAAMYKAKQAGKGTYCWYSGDVDVENQQRADMDMDIRAALDTGQLEVYYQPIVSLDDGEILAAEALLRWDHPEKGMISPSLFIPIAEEIGMIGPIGDYVLRAACAQTVAWRDEGIHLSQIAVNISTAQVRDAGWLDSVRDALSDVGLDARCLNLEVTETDFAADYESMKETLQKVQELGICISIDDFGMGQSSLSRLKDFPVIHLKIDGSFVRDIEHNKNDNALLRSIVEMAHGQGIKVTAEWVETEAQMDILRSIGCDYAQGYFISPALPATAFVDFIGHWTFAQRQADAA